MHKQAAKYGMETAYAEVSAIDQQPDGTHLVRTAEQDYTARAVIITGGADYNRLGVPGEDRLIGKGVSVVFSQVFFKPPRGGGPKPVHQDNFYFGPENPEAIVTAWVALDDADLENGCMHFGEGTHKAPPVRHVAPEGQPFNLLIPDELARGIAMTPAPVPKGGVSFHHGNVFHQSADNDSDRWRRAVAPRAPACA